MLPSCPLVRAVLAVGVLLLSGPAEARFGKRSAPTPSGGTVHDASPVDSQDDSPSSSAPEPSGEESSSGGASPVETARALLDLFFFVTDVADRVQTEAAAARSRPSASDEAAGPPMYSHAEESAMRVATERRAAPARPGGTLMVRVGADGQSLRGGQAATVRGSIEGEWVGVDGEVMSVVVPTDDGTSGMDELRLFSAHLSVAVYSDDRTRLRLHGGMAVVRAPDLSVVSPSVAVSFERCLIGALDVESRGQLVPMDYLQVDARAGLAAHVGVLSLRAGWRWLMLDDRGLVDGVAHRDVFSGPYAGAGLYF